MLQIKFKSEEEKEAWQEKRKRAEERKRSQQLAVLKKKKRKRGRPRKKLRRPAGRKGRKADKPLFRVRFVETRLGQYLYVYAPVQYHILMQYARQVSKSERYNAIRYNMVSALAVQSGSPAFRTARFTNAMIEYRIHKNCVSEKAAWKIRDVVYFAKHSYHVHKLLKSVEGF